MARTGEPPPDYVAKIEIPFDHSDVQVLVDSMFLDGSLHPLAVHSVPAGMPSWIKAGLSRTQRHCRPWCSKGHRWPDRDDANGRPSHKDWSRFAKRWRDPGSHAWPARHGRQRTLCP